MTLVAFETRVDRITKVTTGVVSAADRTDHIAAAVLTYSSDKPYRPAPLRITPDGSSYEYQLNATGRITDWAQEGFHIDEIVYPADQQTKYVVWENHYYVYQKSTGTWWVKFPRTTPASGYFLDIYYSRPHTLSSSEDTITASCPNDIEAVAQLAASLVCEAAYEVYTEKSIASIGVDTSDHKDRARLYAERAKRCREWYEAHVDKTEKSSGEFLTWEIKSPGGADLPFTHAVDL